MTELSGWEFALSEDLNMMDSDYYLALQLQQAELLKERYEMEQERQRHSHLKYQKVSSSRFASGAHAYYNNHDDAILDYSDNEDYYDDEEEEAFTVNVKRHHVTSKTSGRLASGQHAKSHTPPKQQPFVEPQRDLPANAGPREISAHVSPMIQRLQDLSDEKTAGTILKLLTQKILSRMNGVAGQGKEATIYFAEGGSKTPATLHEECAVKVFKTSNMDYNSREVYINGIWQSRYLEVRVNPRKFIKLWAEKEFRNLKKLYENSLPVPRPILVRNNVVIMSFIGKEGWSAPRLIEVANKLEPAALNDLYWQLVSIVKRMYKLARIVHAALSAYNLLVDENDNASKNESRYTLYVIDVSQSVDIDHKYSTHFLRRDCNIATQFFRGKGVSTLPIRTLYEFVSSKDLNGDGTVMEDYDLDAEIESLKRMVTESAEPSEDERLEEQVWMNLELPKYLKDILDPIEVQEDGVLKSTIESLNLVKTSY